MKILLVDDHSIVRQGLKQLLGSELTSVEFGEASTSQQALDAVEREPWDIVVLDISLPGRGGLDALKEMTGLRPELRVLVLSMHPEEQYAVRALRSGASGYVTKDTAPEELVDAVSQVLSGRKFVSAALAQRLAIELTGANQAPHELLSDREFQVFRMLAAGKTVKEIGFELKLSEKTISTYRTRVMTKMHTKTNAELVQYALHHGLMD